MGRRKKTTEEFIKEASTVHGDKYDYSLVKIDGYSHTRVKIKCNECGSVFEQIINNHLNGKGCSCCDGNKRLTKEEFVKRAAVVHGNKYDYSLTEISGNNKTKVKIICNTCGHIFEQKINNHLNGQGCPRCAGNKKLTKEEFVARATAIHGNKYRYDNVIYINDKTPIFIACPIHGDFKQLPSVHKDGCGCPLCNQSHLEEQTGSILEKNNIVFDPKKKFPWLKNKREMPLDSYLPEYNIAIECQGIQHYKASGNVFTEERVEIIQQRDILKYQLCQEHSIPIYYVRYDDNVEERINEILHNSKL